MQISIDLDVISDESCVSLPRDTTGLFLWNCFFLFWGGWRKVILSLYLLLWRLSMQSNHCIKMASTEVTCYEYCQNWIGKAIKTNRFRWGSPSPFSCQVQPEVLSIKILFKSKLDILRERFSLPRALLTGPRGSQVSCSSRIAVVYNSF